MNKIITVLLLFISAIATAQSSDADKIIGTYNTEGNKGKVDITKNGDKYNGTLIWTKESGALDKNNPDEKERKNKVVGKVILKDFVYTGSGTWEKGTVYDPESGKTYSGKLTLTKDGDLNMRGFVGFSAFGRTTVWKREK
ncbi:uncharacterized protein (DUF2147 family) [Algoriphagus sp. 4150]|uniref:DUF2147 domain-containing protein n=1 Tax=Algoriphagus sp. 4150 TaxID=2817756 RepID=UPI00285B0F4C|nr:DUF2147 domain-containing protein [Algoriphagus sp. 4150]MDR7132456.1 uncharacterized protein (DUF2147 family) [Algoriphagus sp. 4150]